MKRYDIYAFIGYDYNGPYATWEHPLADEGSGQFVLHSEAQAEIDRLRGLVRSAFKEGFHSAYCTSLSESDELREWNGSEASKSLTPPSPTHNQQ